MRQKSKAKKMFNNENQKMKNPSKTVKNKIEDTKIATIMNENST